MPWQPGDISFHLLTDDTDDTVAFLRIMTPAGDLLFMAESEAVGGVPRLCRAHLHSDSGANSIGIANLRLIARVAMERMSAGGGHNHNKKRSRSRKKNAAILIKFKERIGQLGRVEAISRVASGSPAISILRLSSAKTVVNVPAAALALSKRGVPMLHAKRASEAIQQTNEFVVSVPLLEDPQVLGAELRTAGIAASVVDQAPVDVAAVRKRQNLTQEQFALRYNLDLETVQNWERGRRTMDKAAENYLRVIDYASDAAARAQEKQCVEISSAFELNSPLRPHSTARATGRSGQILASGSTALSEDTISLTKTQYDA